MATLGRGEILDKVEGALIAIAEESGYVVEIRGAWPEPVFGDFVIEFRLKSRAVPDGDPPPPEDDIPF